MTPETPKDINVLIPVPLVASKSGMKFMKQALLAFVLILVPVAAFTGFEVFFQTPVATAASLGDLSSLKAIVADVQAKIAAADFPAAKARITDFETAWDEAEAGMRPLNPEAWSNVDMAADAALKAVRAATPDSASAAAKLEALQKALTDPSAKPAN